MYWALKDLCKRFSNRTNTAIVLGSEFQWAMSEITNEQRKEVEDMVLASKLPLFFISLGASPDGWFRHLANESGGAYLGALLAQDTKLLAKDTNKVWIYVNQDHIKKTRSYYIPGEAVNVEGSKDIIEHLEDSNIKRSKTFEESDRDNKR